MPTFGPISRTNLIRGLRALGFEGPYAGGRHAYMVRGEQRIALPNPIKAILASTSWRVFFAKQVLHGTNGSRSEDAYRARG